MSPKKGPATLRASSKKKASSSTASHRSGPWVIGAHDAKPVPAIEETLLDPLPSTSVSGPDIKKNGISKKLARRLDEHHDDHHPGWAALSPDKRTKLGETDAYLPEGITEGMLMEDAQAREGDVLVPETAAAAAAPPNAPPATAAAPSSVPLLPPFPEVETVSSTTGNSPLAPLNEDLDDDSGSSSWTRKLPRLDECEDEEDTSATRKDWNDYVFKKQSERMKRLIPNPDLEDTEPFVNSFVPVAPRLTAQQLLQRRWTWRRSSKTWTWSNHRRRLLLNFPDLDILKETHLLIRTRTAARKTASSRLPRTRPTMTISSSSTTACSRTTS